MYRFWIVARHWVLVVTTIRRVRFTVPKFTCNWLPLRLVLTSAAFSRGGFVIASNALRLAIAQADSERLTFLVQMAAFEAERLGRVRDVMMPAIQLREDAFALELRHANCKRGDGVLRAAERLHRW